MRKTDRNLFYYSILLIICFFAFFINNDIIPADLMESRNLATAQEMVRNGNYLLPTMNGELRLEKPPLPTWIAAFVEQYIPGNLSAQRAVAGLAATQLIIFLFLLVSRLTRNRKVGLLSALVCASSLNVLLIGRTATWDIYCHSFMLGAIYFLVMAMEKPGTQWKRFLLAGTFMGLSFLSKGPVSFYALLLPFIISYVAVFNISFKKKLVPLILMMVIFLAIAFWWPIYILSLHQDFAISVVDKETDSWASRNVRPLFYYWKFPTEAGIWTLFWIVSIFYFFWKRKNEDKRAVYAMSIIWTFVSLILLSLIPEKKTRYLFPTLIPGAINIGFYFYYTSKYLLTKYEELIIKIITTLVACILLIFPIVLYIKFVEEDLLSVSLFIVITLSTLTVSLLMLNAIYGKRGLKVLKVFKYFILTMIIAECFYIIPIGHMFINDDRHSIRLIRENKEVMALPFYHNQQDWLRMELVYEANHTILPLDLKNDSLIQKKLPFVLISNEPIDSLMSGKNFSIQYIDTFDNNWRKSDTKRYNRQLISYVAIIREPIDSISTTQDSTILNH